jgi:hypothetical protein
MSPLLGRGKKQRQETTVASPMFPDGWRFTLKGSPRHYDDVYRIIEEGGQARVYFGEELTYERGAGVALWRVSARGFDWLPTLYAWWAEQERLEPIQFSFHLYLPSNLKYPAMNLRAHPPAEVEAFIKENAPRGIQAPK